MDAGPLTVEVIPFAMTFRRPYVTATGTLRERQSVLLRLRDADGLTALGEGVPMTLRGGHGLEHVVAELEAWGRDQSILPTTPPARCAVATALADLEAKRREIPLWKLLDPGIRPRTLFCNATITAGSPADVAGQGERWAADGFNVFKLKAGPEEALPLARAARAALGSEAKIRLDANGSWGEAAAGIIGRLEPLAIELIEEPLTGLDQMAKLAQDSPVPLVADESVNTPAEATEARSRGSCVAATVKLSKIGSLAADLGGALPTYLSSALDGPVGIAAAAHAAQTLDPDLPWPGVAHGLATERLFRESLSTRGPLVSGNRLDPPADGYGLGVELDERMLASCRL